MNIQKTILIISIFLSSSSLAEAAASFLNPVASEVYHPRKYSIRKLSEEDINQNKQQIVHIVDTYWTLGQKKDFRTIYNDVISYAVKDASTVDAFVEVSVNHPGAPSKILDYKIFTTDLITVITAKCRVWVAIENKESKKEVRILDMYLSRESTEKGKQDKQGVWKIYAAKSEAELAKHFNNYPKISENTRDCILGKKVVIGMTQDDVIASWGKPDDINKTITQYGVNEQWVYNRDFLRNNQYVYFENNKVTAIQSH